MLLSLFCYYFPMIHPKTIFTGDNLPILRGINSQSIDLIYLDPPFNSNSNYAAPIGSKAAGAEFKDTWNLTDINIAWLDLIETKYPRLNRVIHAAMTDSDKSYLIYMSVRLLEMRRILKNTGSIYLHCDPTMSHYLKLVMDSLFGKANFRNEIVWCYTTPSTPHIRQFVRCTNTLLFYSKGKKWAFNKDDVRVPYKGGAPHGGQKWSTDNESLSEWRKRKSKQGKIPENWWTIPKLVSSKERTGYPTQKPLALLDRIIKASSNENDVVFDPFCGCATTLVAADRLQRNWIGIDISPKAAELVVERIKADQGMFQDIIHRSDIPQRTDLGHIPSYNHLSNKAKLYGEQAGFCNGCKEHFHRNNLEVDHLIAKSQGGTDHIDNLQLLCAYCNRLKGNRGMEYLLTKLNAE